MRKPCKKSTTPITFIQLAVMLTYVVALLISNIISSRQTLFFGRWELTGAIMIFPITYILSDVISEVFGYKWSRRTCYMAFAANIALAIIGYFVCSLPSPAWWGDAAAFSTVLQAVPRITIASLISFVVGDWVNDVIFSKMKGDKDHKGYGFRAILSSFFGVLLDSLIFIPMAFAGSMPVDVLLNMIILQVIVKICYEIVILPVNTFVMKKISKTHQKQLQEYNL